MRIAIFTLNIGEPSGFIPCMLSARKYAQRHNISYFISDRIVIRFYAACFEKFQGFKLFDMDFDQFCAEIVRQDEGEYVVFANRPVSKAQVFEAVRQLEQTGINTAMDNGKNFIIVKRQPLLEAGSFAHL